VKDWWIRYRPLSLSPFALSCIFKMLTRLKLLAQLLYDPVHSMAEIRSRAPFIFAISAATLASLIYNLIGPNSYAIALRQDLRYLLFFQDGIDESFFARLIYEAVVYAGSHLVIIIFLAGIFVPLCIWIAGLFDRRGAPINIRKDYRPMLSCFFYAWAAAHLLMFLPALLLFKRDGEWFEYGLSLAPMPYFLLLLVIGLRAVLRISAGLAAVTILLSLIFIPLLLFGTVTLLSFMSPFLLIILIILLRGYFSQVMAEHRAKIAFKQNLEAATLNPADASAHYNLGLIYQKRGQYQEAIESFKRAVEIDVYETDAHYQLGRIALEQGRYSDAISHFDTVVRQDMDHSQSEVWREIGCTYFAAGQYTDALEAFERFLARRPSDAEGMYRHGLTLYKLGRSDEAASQMRAVIETVRTAPAYKYRLDRRWMIEAQSFLRSQ